MPQIISAMTEVADNRWRHVSIIGDTPVHDNSASHLIARQYSAVHGANMRPCFTDLTSLDVNGRTAAALGYRRANREWLFLEAYLDRSIEQELSNLFERTVTRGDIVEIGNLASDNAMAMISLWAEAANDLGSEAEIAVAVLTAPLRSMFRRLGVTLYEIAPARPERLGEKAEQWGAYYQLEPMVCAGFIAEGQQSLARLITRRGRAA